LPSSKRDEQKFNHNKGKVMDNNNVAKGEAFYLNNNQRKNADNHPDFVGKLIITQDQLRALITIHEKAREDNREPVLQVDVSGWKGKSKNDGSPYLFCKHEIYTGPRKDPSQRQAPKPAASEDDWL